MREISDITDESSFNDASLTPGKKVKELLSHHPPDVIDLYAYYQNPRTEQLASNDPDRTYISVGLETLSPKIGTDSPFADHLPPNYFHLNFGAKSFLELLPSGSVDEIHFICIPPESEYTSRVVEESIRVLKPDGSITLIKCQTEASPVLDALLNLGWTYETLPLTEIDMKSNWVASRILNETDRLIKIQAKNKQ